MLNHIVLMGRLTRDPELRHTQSGIAVASFSLAVERDFKEQSTGNRPTDFIDIVAWRHTAEFVHNYFTKGRMAVVEGRLQIRDWQDQDGNKRRSAEVIADSVYFGDSKKDSGSGTQQGYAPQSYQQQPSYQGGGYGNGGYSGQQTMAGYPPSDYGGGQVTEFAELSDDDGELPF